MGLGELLFIGVGLSMDAFAAAVCKGLKMRKINYAHAFVIGLFFGGFQAAMPLLGWLLGRRFEGYITAFDHWMAFVVLSMIGGKMVFEACSKDKDEDSECSGRLEIKELLLLSIATSIDALAVGITFAFLKADIVAAVSVIGITTLVLSFVGVAVGNKFGSRYKNLRTYSIAAFVIKTYNRFKAS